MTIKLYDLAGANPEIMFSPFSWRVRMALLHKDLDFEVIPWRFSDRSSTEESGFDSIPVIKDGGKWVGDSWEIALYLDKTYPQKLLMKDSESQATSQLIMALCGTHIFPAVIGVAVYQAYKILDEDSKPYFRESREAMFGRTLEEINADEKTAKAALERALTPFSRVLVANEFIGGDTPSFADFVLFGLLKWADIVSEYRPLDDDIPVGEWFCRLEQMYGGHAAAVPTVRSLSR